MKKYAKVVVVNINASGLGDIQLGVNIAVSNPVLVEKALADINDVLRPLLTSMTLMASDTPNQDAVKDQILAGAIPNSAQVSDKPKAEAKEKPKAESKPKEEAKPAPEEKKAEPEKETPPFEADNAIKPKDVDTGPADNNTDDDW